MNVKNVIVSGTCLLAATGLFLSTCGIARADDAGTARISDQHPAPPPAAEPKSESSGEASTSDQSGAELPPGLFSPETPPLVQLRPLDVPVYARPAYGGAYPYFSSDVVASRLRVGTWTGERAGLPDNGDAYVSVFLPYAVKGLEDTYFFAEVRGMVTYEGRGGFSTGVGYKFFDRQHQRIWTLSGWFDYDDGHERDYKQWGVSFETLGRWFDARVNGYFPFGRDSSVVDEWFTGESYFSGHNLFFVRQRAIESTYAGLDAEIGGPLPILGRYGFYGYVGGYYRQSNDFMDTGGVRVRFEANVTQDLLLGISVSDDRLWDTNVWMNVVWTLPDGRARRWFRPRPVEDRLNDRVARSYRVLTHTDLVTDAVPAVSAGGAGGVAPLMPGGGTALMFAFIDPQASGASEGTFENPFHSLADYAALPESQRRQFSIIIVSEAPEDNPYQGLDTGITLFDNQRLLSEAILPTIQLLPNGFTIPGFEPDPNATLPVLSNASGGNVITLAGDNTEVAGFIIDGRVTGAVPNSVGIYGRDIRNFNIHSNTFRNYSNAVVLVNATGEGYFRSNKMLGTPGVSLNGFRVENSGAGELNLTIGALPLPGAQGNLAIGNDGDAFSISARDGAVINLDFRDNRIASEDWNHNGQLDDALTEDRNGNGRLDDGEDLNGNGRLDLALTEDANGNGRVDFALGEDINGDGRLQVAVSEDVNGNGVLDPGEDNNEDVNGNGVLDPGEDVNGDGVLNLGNGNGRLDLALTEDFDGDGQLTPGNGNGLRLSAVGPGSQISGIIADNIISDSRGEDRNLNGILDPGEDLDGDGVLDPGNGIIMVADDHAVIDFYTVGEDINGNGKLDPSEDRNGNGRLDPYFTEDVNGNGVLDSGEDLNGNGVLDLALNEDTNGNGVLDPGEDLNGNGQLDLALSEDSDGDGVLDPGEDLNGNGVLDVAVSEDFNGNGVLDPGEDLNNNGRLDVAINEDANGNGVLDQNEDLNGNSFLDPGEDANGNGILDVDEDINQNGRLDLALSEDVNGNGVLDDGEDVNEDANGNGMLDPGEDLNGDGFLNVGNGNGRLDLALTEDLNGNGRLDPAEDLDGDGVLDGGRIITNNVITRNTGDGVVVSSTNESEVRLRFTRNKIGLLDDRSAGNGGIGINISADSGVLVADFGFVLNEDLDEDLNGNGQLDPGEDVNGNNILDTPNGQLDVVTDATGAVVATEDVNGNGILDTPNPDDGNLIVANHGGGISIDLTGTAVAQVRAFNNKVIGLGGGDMVFVVNGDTTGQAFSIFNTSDPGMRLNEFVWNIAPAGLEFNTDPTSGVPFAAQGGTDVTTGLASVNGSGQPFTVPNLSTQLKLVFTSFDSGVNEDVNGNGVLDPGEDRNEDANGNGVLDPGEDLNGDGVLNLGNGNNILDTPPQFVWLIDVNGSGGVPAQIFGNDLAGSRVRVVFSSGQVSTGTLRVEDQNGNGVLDPGEDLNNNGVLDPQLAALVFDSHDIGTGDGIRIRVQDQAVLQQARFENNVITNHGGNGLSVKASTNGTVQQLLIRDNDLTDNGLDGTTGTLGSGIRLATAASAPNPALGLPPASIVARIERNRLDGNAGNGVLVTADSGQIDIIQIDNNTLQGNGNAVALATANSGSINARVTNNTMDNGTQNSLSATADSGVITLHEISNNSMTGNSGDGIALSAENGGAIIIADSEDTNGNAELDPGEDTNGNGFLDRGLIENTVSNNGGNGLYFTADNGTLSLGTVANNTIVRHTAGTGGIVIDATDAVVTGTFIGNVVSGDPVNNPSEDLNGNGLLDPGEDANNNGVLDTGTGPGFSMVATGTFGGPGSVFNITIGGTGTDEGNLFESNAGAGIAFIVRDTATGTFHILNNVITGTVDDNDPRTDYQGEGIHVGLRGTTTLREATSLLINSEITGNTIGDATSATLGNVGGIVVAPQEDTTLQNFTISNNLIANNSRNGILFRRRDDATINNVVISGNTIDSNTGEDLNGNGVLDAGEDVNGDGVLNGAGIAISAINGRRDTLDFVITDNTITNNTLHGVHLWVGADAVVSADIQFNNISNNTGTGVLMEGDTSVAGDSEIVGGSILGNTIADNQQFGVQINGATGTAIPIIIGQDAVDPTTGRSLGNILDQNGFDAVEINSGGSFELSGNTITRNGWAALAQANQGGGVDINADNIETTLSLRMVGNTIEDNRGDGVEILSRGTSANQVFVTALGNTIDFNDGRGVDILNADDATTYVRFGDGTDAGSNTIVSNGGIGFYVVNTASPNQTQDVSADVDLLADGSLDTAPDLVLDLNRNRITSNNNTERFDGGGLVLRVGTCNASTSFTGADATGDIFGDGSGYGDPSGNGVGSNSGDILAGNGRVNARVVDNTFGGNFGNDVFIESFTSTVDPPSTAGTWDNTQFTVTTFRRDPLARLNLVFRGNTGDAADLTRGESDRSATPGSSNVTGAYYANAEADFKSRENNKTAPNIPGPFPPGGTRRRNAQRIAGRDVLPPNSGPDINPITGLGIFEYDGVGASTFRVESDFDVSGFTSTDGFILDGALPPFLSGNAQGVPFTNPVTGEEPFGWGTVAPGTFTFPDYLFP